MVVHNTRDMVRISTLKTIRHTAGQDVRFVVVDSGSSDGSETWLRLLADRGDIQLIRTSGNIGRGPGLELARRSSRSKFIVTLDSGAFPISDSWLERLRERLRDGVKAVGICHRDYIHPSCLMLERATLDEMHLTFLEEKTSPSSFDVAERISVEIKARNFRISGLQQTGFLRRGSLSMPVGLGATYEEVVDHQWYTTRSVLARGGWVDDVSPNAINGSLEELFSATQAEAREAAIIVGVRAKPDEPDRAQNAVACLRALNSQDIARWRFGIIVVEQDSEPRLEEMLAPYADRYCFAYNPGLYNRGWGFNIGARLTQGTRTICLIDADLVTPRDFVRRGLEGLADGLQALLPYCEVLYLDPSSTKRVLNGEDPGELTGQLFDDSHGGAMWVSAELYRNAGGHDERFCGWGYEDREFYNRLNRMAGVARLPGRLHHLHHRHRDLETSQWVAANARLFQEIEGGRAEASSCAPGDAQRYASRFPEPGSAAPKGSARDWQNWHRWEPSRIQSILSDELRGQPRTSARGVLAAHLVRLGRSLLDVGCGPGALWPRLQPFREQLRWVGVDVTREMLVVAHHEFPDVPICRADAVRLPFGDSCFDVVLLRHVLEHVPLPMKDAALNEAMRVARKAVVLDFYVPPARSGPLESRRLPENFLETRWTAADIIGPAAARQWLLRECFALRQQAGENNEVWVFEPSCDQPCYPAGLKVSIVMPTYRRPHTLLRTIDTVRAQRYSNWELLVIDNSGDGGYMFGDPRIQMYNRCECASASYARNWAIERATGDLMCFFDDDDDMFPDYLEQFVTAFQSHPQAKMVRCGMLVGGSHQDFSYATPECCIRREFATPTWESCGCHDQVYFAGIVERNGWRLDNGDIVIIREALCRANSDRVGGLREGSL